MNRYNYQPIRWNLSKTIFLKKCV
ncbi:hypothetical protein CY0110_16577 [Crocosphaera chwakensis CCY0110]|uniref:Uncharacterized protein n=1 Tax=Crocosphaera chwakensis CCY0110 TaxID=391612 RepID=A3IHZ7_9CHRO|nr:hypothetical protein CY0110_16577 [Crocosphaera chwakensis CCY0110]